MPPNFTSLPPELRNEIYSHVFNYGSNTLWVGNGGRFYKTMYDTKYLRQPLALLAVNHQISDEAAACFYGKIRFRGEWPLMADFLQGIGAWRRDMIRSVSIWSLYDGLDAAGEVFELLSALPSLRIVRIDAAAEDFTGLQNILIQGGILKLVGKVAIDVHNTYNKVALIDLPPGVLPLYTDRYVWSCARGTTQWTGGERIRTFIKQPVLDQHRKPFHRGQSPFNS